MKNENYKVQKFLVILKQSQMYKYWRVVYGNKCIKTSEDILRDVPENFLRTLFLLSLNKYFCINEN